MSVMKSAMCNCRSWLPVATGVRTATFELRSGAPALVHVSRTGADDDGPAFVLTKEDKSLKLTGLNKSDIIVIRAKREGTEANVTVMIDKGKLL